MEVFKRFASKIRDGENGCMIWTASTRGKNGYGCFKVNGKTISAHRFAWIVAYGEIPDGKLICHKCDNKLCVNPAHLFLGTYRDNFMDGVGKGRMKFIEPPQFRPVKHGTPNAYRLRNCRCPKCRKYQSDRMKNYHKKVKASLV